MPALSIHHIGYLVKKIEKARQAFLSLGYEAEQDNRLRPHPQSKHLLLSQGRIPDRTCRSCFGGFRCLRITEEI